MSMLDRGLVMHLLGDALLKAEALNANDLTELYASAGEFIPKEDIFISQEAGRFTAGALMINAEVNNDPFISLELDAVDNCNFSNIHVSRLHDGAVVGVSLYFENSKAIH